MLIFVTKAWINSKWTWRDLAGTEDLRRGKSSSTFLLFGNADLEQEFEQQIAKKAPSVAKGWREMVKTKTGKKYALESMSNLPPKALLNLVQEL